MKMKVIKNGVEEYREVDHYDMEPTGLRSHMQYQSIPVMTDNERAQFTVCGKCYIYEVAE